MTREPRKALDARQMKKVNLHAATRAAIDEAVRRHRSKGKALGEALQAVEEQVGRFTHGAMNALALHLGIDLADVYQASFWYEKSAKDRRDLVLGKKKITVKERAGATKKAATSAKKASSKPPAKKGPTTSAKRSG